MEQILQRRARFGEFELDPRAGELHKNGQGTLLQEQQLKVLLMLIEREGEIVTRDDIKKKLWPNDTIVEFDHSINAIIRNLRRLLDDSADDPKYIGTVARRGYRIMVPVEWVGASDSSAKESFAEPDAVSSRAKRSGVEGPAVDSESLPKAKLEVGRLTGKVVSYYRVLEVIGGGGMGLVYRAEDLKLGRPVALKFLPEEVGDDPKARERFQREALAVSSLNHPNICTIYDFDEHEGHLFIAMELLPGKTLREHLSDGRFRLNEPDGLEVAIQIALGLEAAHEKGIIHRDIKPANIFITEKNVAKILDFGVAKFIQLSESAENPHPGNGSRNGAPENNTDNGEGGSLSLTNQVAAAAAPAKESTLTRTGTELGTAGYMSPEQVRGEKLDARTDIFSFGLVLYEMATGQRAFNGETAAVVHDAILHNAPVPLRELNSTLPASLVTTIDKCLEKDRERRYQSASDLAFALKALSETADGPTHIVEHSSSSKKWVLLVVAPALLAIVAAAFVWWIRPTAIPVVESVTQLTNDGQPKTWGALVTDGSRLYFNEGLMGSKKIVQVSTAGGETSVVPTRLTDPRTMGIAPDGSSLLVFDGEASVKPLWTVPLPTGEPKRLGAIEGNFADFLPDGRVVFAAGSDVSAGLYVAEKDGSNVRKLYTGPLPYCIRVSPDGRQIVGSTYVAQDDSTHLIEIAADGSGAHEILSGNSEAGVGCSQSWTPDGNYLVTPYGGNILLMRMKTGIFQPHQKPIRLTDGQLSYLQLCLSRDGKRLYAVGSKQRVELVRYDVKSHQFAPFLSGMNAISVTFSRDGQWVAYVSLPDGSLWRSRADGTAKLQLTYPPTSVMDLAISPDGKRIAFGNNKEELHVIKMDGTSEQVLASRGEYPEASWSPDGNSLVFTSPIESKEGSEHRSMQLETINLQNGTHSVVPSSEGMGSAFWMTPDMLVAWKEDATKLVALNLRNGKMTDLASGLIVAMAASPDLKYVYYEAGGPEPKAMRIRVADNKVEEITSLKSLRLPTYVGGQIAVAPDGSAVFPRDIGSQEIYALTIKWP